MTACWTADLYLILYGRISIVDRYSIIIYGLSRKQISIITNIFIITFIDYGFVLADKNIYY